MASLPYKLILLGNSTMQDLLEGSGPSAHKDRGEGERGVGWLGFNGHFSPSEKVSLC